ncbi:hypothetical protein [Pedobacter sp. L105]|uniref:hypothetical protein n=1 Tax=Pedobacter sp. L105 TaxID=1641871 RepID=UPI00131C8ACC|nr:hypothetical protein [Pedobacter sp. L105]
MKVRNSTRYKLLLFLFIGSLLAGCKRNGVINGENYTLTAVDNSRNLYLQSRKFSGVIFAHHSTDFNKKKTRRFTPSAKEIFKAEQIFQNYLRLNKAGEDGIKVNSSLIQAPFNYYRQYLGYYNEQGQKTIFFNCLLKRSAGSEWKRSELAFRDGENNCFSILVNIHRQSCSSFTLNGGNKVIN